MRTFIFALVLALCGVLTSPHTLSAEPTTTDLSCGKWRTRVYNSPVKEAPFFVVHVGNKIHPFEMTSEYFEIRCDAFVNGDPVLLINHHCGGSGCSSEVYTLFDPKTGDKLLDSATPRDTAKVLGHNVRQFSCNTTHCRGMTITPNASGEYCFLSPVELG
jgi:hypothetical protein